MTPLQKKPVKTAKNPHSFLIKPTKKCQKGLGVTFHSGAKNSSILHSLHIDIFVQYIQLGICKPIFKQTRDIDFQNILKRF
jgi:hypothetical protein